MRENHPKRRQLRKEQRKLVRRAASRAGFPAVLAVCEGRETEPNYIRGLCEFYRINLANVTMCSGGSETDAAALVRIAREKFGADPDFDRVFVVCDIDSQSLDRAVALAKTPMRMRDGQRIKIEILCSRPCFEFWLLLHFEYSARAYRNAAEVRSDLLKHLTNYDKADPHIFRQVKDGLDRALQNIEKLKRDLAASGAQSPDSDMHALVKQLLSMRRGDKS